MMRKTALRSSRINLNDAAQLVYGIGSRARLAQPPQDEPCRLLGDTDLFGELHRGNPLAGGNQQVHGVDPLVQRHLGPLEDRSGTNGEIEVAGVAVVEAGTLRTFTDPLRFTVRANRAIGPEMALQVDPRGFCVGNELHEGVGADGGFGHLCSPPVAVDRGPNPIEHIAGHLVKQVGVGPVPIGSSGQYPIAASYGVPVHHEVTQVLLDVIAARSVRQAKVLAPTDDAEVLGWARHLVDLRLPNAAIEGDNLNLPASNGFWQGSVPEAESSLRAFNPEPFIPANELDGSEGLTGVRVLRERVQSLDNLKLNWPRLSVDLATDGFRASVVSSVSHDSIVAEYREIVNCTHVYNSPLLVFKLLAHYPLLSLLSLPAYTLPLITPTLPPISDGCDMRTDWT